MTISPSSTSAGKGGDSGSRGASRPSGAGSVRQRKPTSAASSSRRSVATNNAGSMWRFYQEDSPGLKV
jgi:hypothetical protein